MGKNSYAFYKKEGLDKSFSKVFDFPLTVVTAPMGYGKSTAVKHFLCHSKAYVIEIVLSEKQVLESYLWDTLTQEVMKFNKEAGEKLIQVGLPKNKQQVWEIIAEIKSSILNKPIVIVIDDFHLLNSPEINELIKIITYQNIEKLHLVLIGRKQPNLDLLEMQIKDLCYPIGQFELMFKPKDIREYFKMHGYLLSDTEAYKLYQNTEGWISAIYLMMLEYKETGKIEDTRPVGKLIERIIYNKYDENMKCFLLKLSIMNEFSFVQASFVTEEEKAGEYLQYLEGSNAFIIYDCFSDIYRIHNLMSQFLYNKLIRRTDISKKRLYERLGDWYLENNQPFEAFSYYIETKNYVKVLEQLSQIEILTVIEKNAELLACIFKQIPVELAVEYPRPYLIYAYNHLFIKDKKEAAYILDILEKRWTVNGLEESILGEIHLAKCFLYLEDMPRFLEYLVRAERHLPKGSQIIYADSILSVIQPQLSFMYYTKQGAYTDYMEMYAESSTYYESIGHGAGRSMKYLIRAEYYLETAQLDEAYLQAKKAIYKAEIKQQKSIIIYATLCLARIYLYQNKCEEAISLLETLRGEMLEENDVIRLHITETALGYMYGCINELEKIPTWIRQDDLSQDLINMHKNPFECSIYYFVLVLEKEFIKLEIRSEEMIAYYIQNNMLLGLIYMFIYQAIAKFNLYGMKKGKKSLSEALEIASKDAVVMPFVEMGIYILPILYEIQREELFDTDYMDQILRMSTAYCIQLEKKNEDKVKPAGKLTKREEEILQLIAQGMTNKEIAKSLFLADITVGKTCTNIFKKLEVKGRVGAIQYLNGSTQ